MEDLVDSGLLPARPDVEEWLLPDNHDSPALPTSYVILFALFHEHGLAFPPHRFLCRFLDNYKVELRHLNPNKIQHLTVFITLCEGYLGIRPHFDLWGYFSSSPYSGIGRGANRTDIGQWGVQASISGIIASTS